MTFHDTGFVSVRHTLLLRDISLDCVDVAQASSLNEMTLEISSPVLGFLSMTLDEYAWELFAQLGEELDLKPRVPIRRKGELERVLVLRQLSGNPNSDCLLSDHSRDLAVMVGRLQWIEGENRKFEQEMTDDALMLHDYLMVLCKWQGKLIYYANALPDTVRAWWRDTELVNLFELLMVQFFALRMYNIYLEDARSNAERALEALSDTAENSDIVTRQKALSGLLEVESVRAEVALAVNETQRSTVSLSYMIGQVFKRYDRVIGLTERLEVVKVKLADLGRLNDVIVGTLSQYTNEANLQASLKEARTLRWLTLLLLVLTVVLAVGTLWEPASDFMTWIIDRVSDMRGGGEQSPDSTQG